MKNAIHIFVYLMLLSFQVCAQEEMVFDQTDLPLTTTGTRTIPPSREQISAERIKDLGVLSPADALEDSSQIQVIGSSAFGQTRSISVRGAPSSYTTVFWNGVRMNDWLAPSANAEGAQAGQEFSSQVQIVKGPQTLSRSSSAIAGVIEYEYDADQKYVQLSGTDSNIHREGFEYFRQTENQVFGLGGTFYQSDYGSAFSSAKLSGEQKDRPLETDRYHLRSGSLLQGYRWSKQTGIQLLVHRQDTWSADDSGSNDDPNAVTVRENEVYSGMVNFMFGSWRSVFRWDHQQNMIRFDNPPDSADSSNTISNNRGSSDRWTLGASRDVQAWGSKQNISIGTEIFTEQGLFYSDSYGVKTEFDRQNSTTESYGIHQLEFDQISLSYGLRTGLQKTALQGQLQYHFDSGISPYVIWGSGYKDPSLYQFYSPYGNLKLNSEQSRTVETGFQFRNAEGDEAQLGFFHYDFENLIHFDMTTFKYANIEKSQSEGMEVLASPRQVSLSPSFELKSELSYQRLESVNLKTKQRTLRVPQDSMKIFLQLNPDRAVNYSLTAKYMGSREDFDGANKKVLPEVMLIHLSSRWKIDLKNELGFRIENAANQPFEEIWGYTPTGRILIATYRRALE